MFVLRFRRKRCRMLKRWIGVLWLVLGLTATMVVPTGQAAPVAQQPTGSIPTVTGTPAGPYILVPERVNVRLEPRVDADLVGVLIAGQQAPALGRSQGGAWIQIQYPGVPGDVAWVYADLVQLNAGAATLPIVEPPPTATPRVTATIDPTLSAQFDLSGQRPTRLPTFTVAAPVVQPTFEPQQNTVREGIPPLLPIAGLLVLGLFGTVISFLRGQ